MLIAELVTNAPPRDREIEAAKARERAAERYGRPVSRPPRRTRRTATTA
jgi:hypothetical protein